MIWINETKVSRFLKIFLKHNREYTLLHCYRGSFSENQISHTLLYIPEDDIWNLLKADQNSLKWSKKKNYSGTQRLSTWQPRWSVTLLKASTSPNPMQSQAKQCLWLDCQNQETNRIASLTLPRSGVTEVWRSLRKSRSGDIWGNKCGVHLPNIGLQVWFITSRQTDPLSSSMFGWKILLTKPIDGDL